MASTEHHMPDVDAQKISLLPWGNSNYHSTSHNGYAHPHNGSAPQNKNHDQDMKKARSRRKVPPRNEGFIAAVCQWTVEHQVGLSVNLLLLHTLAHICFPRARHSTRKFYSLSYYDAATGKYGAGWDDLYMVLYSMIFLTGLRAATLDYILVPLARVWGIMKRKEKNRFAEQAWIFVYGSVFWSLGMYVMYTHEHWMDFQELWTHWPSRETAGTMKWYYLVQFSFWLQQIFIVNIEERRKDHWQMFTHHVVTCILMFWSYGYHFTKVGNLILCLMDVVDIIFALAKMLKYLKYQTSCDVAFGVFMVAWFITRHVLYMKVIVSLFDNMPGEVRYGCFLGGPKDLEGPYRLPNERAYMFEPFRNPSGTICFNDDLKYGFVNTLLTLQAILLVWLVMIIRVAVRVIKGSGADDSRSDDEDDEDEEELDYGPQNGNGPTARKERETHLQPYEEEVGAEEITLSKPRTSPARRYRKGGGVSSGVTLQSDRKELLGRIGCDGGHD